jgi:heme/copper-type cytochrome/quinol oxidase subunit 2
MLPPTPTPFPPGAMQFDLGNVYSLWSATDPAIQVWNWLGDFALILQVFILLVVVIAGMYILFKFIKQFTRRDAEE